MLAEEEKKPMTIEEMIDMTVKNVPINDNYEFKFPQFNRLWDKRWKRFF